MALYKRGSTYWMDFWFEGRRVQESTKTGNYQLAKNIEAKRRVELVERRAGIKRQAPAPRFDEYVGRFLEWSKANHRPKTYALHKLNTETLQRFFGSRWLETITPGMVEDFKRVRRLERRKNLRDVARNDSVSPATVNRALTTLKLLFHRAKRDGYQLDNPVSEVEMLEEPSGRMRVVSFEEEARYLAQASQPLKDIATIILNTGLRPDEVFRIRREDVSFVQGRFLVRVQSGKTKAARREIALSGDARNILVGMWEGWRFPSPDDPTRRIGSVRKAHDAAIRRAGISPPFRLYDLRHTFATRAVMAGVDLPTLAALLGHTSIQMTMRYVHPAEAHKREAICKLDVYKLETIRRAAATYSEATN